MKYKQLKKIRAKKMNFSIMSYDFKYNFNINSLIISQNLLRKDYFLLSKKQDVL